jgi:hypothetical protein
VAITTKDGLVAAIAAAQDVEIFKSAPRTTVASTWFSLFDLAGNPGAGTLAGTSVAAGVVPTSATAGCPVINAFTGANAGYITNVDFGSSVACRFRLYDMVFKAGAYAFNAAQTLASQPSYSGRVPSGTDYTSCSIWLECVTAFTGNQTITITYTNQAGTAGRTTGAVATAVAPTVGRLFQMPLQAGDTGVQKIESVTSTVSTVGTFNVLVLRRLWSGRCRVPNDGDTHPADKTGLPIVFATSALYLMMATDSVSTGTPELQVSIGNG